MHISRYSKYSAFILLVFIIGIVGCRKERPKPSWEMDLLSPLVVDTINVIDVLNDSLITINPDHSVSFVFNEKIYDVNVDSLVRLPDTLFYWKFNFPIQITIPPGGSIIENFDWPLDFESMGLQGVELEDVLVKSGNIRFEVLNHWDEDILCEFGINSAVKNEVDTFFISSLVPNGEIISDEFDFAGYNLDVTGEGDTAYNVLNYYIGLHNDFSGGEPLVIEPTDSFLVYISFVDILVDYGKGYFGQNTFNFGPDYYDFEFFDNFDVGGFSIENATVNLQIENNYGVDGNVKIIDLEAINNETNESVHLQGNMVDSNMFIDKAIQQGSGLGIIEPSLSTYDFSNTNFNDLISILPDEFAYTIEIQSNVLGDSTNHDNFFYYDYPIGIYMDIEVNQGVMIEDMFVTNTMEWNVEGVKLDNVSEGELIVVFQNGFPFSYNINMYFEDENFDVLDTLLYGGFIESGILDEDFRVSETVESKISVGLTPALEDAIANAKFVRYDLLINSADNEHVKIYSDDIMEMKIIGDFKFKIEP